MSSSIESSKQGDRHHHYLRLGLDVRPRLSTVPADIYHDLAFCFDEEERLRKCYSDICISQDGGDDIVAKGIRALRDLIAMEPRVCDHLHGMVELLNHHLLFGDHSVQIQVALILPRMKGWSMHSVYKIIRLLKNLILDGHTLYRYEAMRTLTFLAAHNNPRYHEIILDSDILEVVRKYFCKLRLEESEVIIQCGNFLSAFCCRNPKLPEKKKELVLDTVKSLFKSIDIEGVMPAVCSAFYHLSYQQDMPVEEIVVRKLFWLASHHYPWIAIPALMVVGNIVRYGQDQQIQSMIAKDMLTRLRRLLDNDSKLVQREACWIISNITATSRIEISSSNSVLVRLCDFLKDEESDVQMDAAWSIFNIFTHDHTKIKWPARRSSGFSTFITKKRSGSDLSTFITKKRKKTYGEEDGY